MALKGGGNNFGIVTRFDLQAFPQGDFWGGSILYDDSASPGLLKAFSGLDQSTGFDQYAALILSFSYVQSTNFFVASANIEYTKPEVNPATFQPFTNLKPQLSNSMRISNQTDFTTEFIQFQPKGRRCAAHLTHRGTSQTENLHADQRVIKTALPDKHIRKQPSIPRIGLHHVQKRLPGPVQHHEFQPLAHSPAHSSGNNIQVCIQRRKLARA